MTDTSTIPVPPADRWGGIFRPNRLVVVLLLAALAAWPGHLGMLTRSLMMDAYVQVSVFVAATLMLFYGAERLFNFDIGSALKNARGAQVPLAALLGATPGCGGAVVVVAAYSSGNVGGFGAVVATLTATMGGDAAFLLIATRPDAAIIILPPLSFVVGILSGWIVDRFHSQEYRTVTKGACEIAPPRIGRIRVTDWTYLALVVPGLIVGGAQLAQVEISHILGVPILPIALVGTFLGLVIWATSILTAMTNTQDAPPVTRMAEETSFISVWVIGAYLAYDYVAEFGGVDIGLLFQSVAPPCCPP